ncbi:hypothetical protein ES703_110010 [subsurface metagenome]
MKIEWIIEKKVGILQSPENPISSNRTIEDLVSEGFDVVITIADYDCCISWKVGVKVAVLFTVTGLNTTISAFIPSRKIPLLVSPNL